MVDRAYLLLRVSPWQCLTSPIIIGSPSPSHPTVRAVFPHTAVRQSSFHSMHSRSLIPDHPAANVDEVSGIQGTIRILLPSEPAAFTPTGQVPSKAYIDESLQGPKGLAGVGVAIVVHPSPHHLIHLLHKFLRRNRSAPFGEGLYSLPHTALGRFARKDIDGHLSAGRTAPLHKGEPEKVESLGQFRDACLVAVDRQRHPRRDGLKRLEGLRRAVATD